MSFSPYATYRDSGVTWLGQVPAHWDVKAARFLMSCNDDVLSEDTPSDYELDYVEISDVDEVNGLAGSEIMKFKDAPSRARRLVRDGDVILSTVRTYLRAIAAIESPPENLVVSTGFAVLRPRYINSKFARYAVAYDGFVQEVISRSKGISYPAINASELVRIALPVPPPDEQQAIADYLDTETARIDALIREKEGLVRLLGERCSGVFETLLSESAISLGGRPSNRSPWLRVVPPNWTCLRVKHIVQSFDQGISPQCEARVPDEHEWGVLKVGCVNSGVFNAKESKALPSEIDPIPEITLHEGDVLVSRANTKNLVGRAAMADKPYPRLMLSDKLYRLKLDRNRCNPAFLVGFLTLPAIRVRIEERATGASASMLNIDRRTILELDLPLPPIDQQKAIVMAADRESAEIRDLSAHVIAEIILLKELRAATIADAVLGRVDVCTHPATPA
jgi:type I restriction enzyme S subunit